MGFGVWGLGFGVWGLGFGAGLLQVTHGERHSLVLWLQLDSGMRAGKWLKDPEPSSPHPSTLNPKP